MASSRGKSLWQMALFMLTVKQMAILGEAGRPFFGYGDECDGGYAYLPQMGERYDFQCDSWPVPPVEGPPLPYGEFGSIRRGAASKYARNRQWVSMCLVGRAREPALRGYAANQYYDRSSADLPLSRDIRSGPYFLPEGPVPPRAPEYFHPHTTFPLTPGPYERPYSGGPKGGGGVRYVAGPPRPIRTSFSPGPSPWDERGEADHYHSQALDVRGGPRGGYSGGPKGFGPSSSPSSSSQDCPEGGGGPARPKKGPNSVSPVLFETVEPEANATTTTTPRSKPRSYSPYTKYGLRLMQ